jgi:transcriptional regulator with XRE-family HTH domain
MSAILYGDRIARYWPDASTNKIKTIIYSGLMGHEEFQYIMDKLTAISSRNIELNRESLDYLEHFKSNYRHEEIVAPRELDIEAFAQDYYRSISVTLKNFRESREMSPMDMAITMNISDAKYQKIENANPPPKAVSLHLAARFKLAFKIPNTVPFVSDMQAFPGFALSRSLHQARELILLDLLKGIDDQAVETIAECAKQITDVQNKLNQCVQI